jgi:hypothetical protein
VQESVVVLESPKSFIRSGIPLRSNGHGRKALDILETTCNQEVFHMARMIANSKICCLAIRSTRHNYEAKITKSSSCTPTLMFHGWFKPATNKEAMYKAMWFCPNDKKRCVLGDVQDFVRGKP